MKYLFLILFFTFVAKAETKSTADVKAAESEVQPVTIPAPSQIQPSKPEATPVPEKHFIAVGQPGGIGPGWLYTFGSSFGYYLDPRIIVLADASLGMSAGASASEEKNPTGSATYATTAGLHIKAFAGKWFYFRGGFDRRNVNWNYSFRDADRNVVSAQRFEASSLGMTVAIGSQWTIKKFTFGADWFGLHYPFHVTIHTEEMVGPVGTNTLHDLRVEEDEHMRRLMPLAGRVYFGASW
jgi:hypothetical protein